jgi:hypothetical protein
MIKLIVRSALLFVLLSFVPAVFAQKATVFGTVRDSLGQALPAVSIAVKGTASGTISDVEGKYTLKVEPGKDVTIVFSFIGFRNVETPVNLKPGERLQINPSLQRSSQNLNEVVVEDQQTRAANLMRIDPNLTAKIPSPSGNFENILFTMPGVSTNNELSSTYNVRGGNFDENLIYVNDIEIYRPFLVRAGQQEGLSFINPDLVSSVLFSAGGFEARYGDKMSSVLDIKYKEPRKFGGSGMISLLGASAHIEACSKDYRFTQLHGFRYRSNRYLLQGLETTGDYQPVFLDYQGYFTYDITDDLELGVLVNYSSNKYRFVPQTRETDFGNVNEALRLTVFFEGQEVSEFETGMGAFTTTYRPDRKTELKLIASGFRTVESETFDITGAYRLDELDRDLGSDNFGEVKFNRGNGGFINHARNYIDADVFNLQHKGSWTGDDIQFYWGARWQHEQIMDEIKDWEYQDSTGYSVPQSPGITEWIYLPGDSLNPVPVSPRNEIPMRNLIRNSNDISSNRYMGYVQAVKSWELDTHQLILMAGVRSNYWDWNGQLVVSPRASLAFKPNWKRDWMFRAAWGIYHQPPFYREMRDLQGNANPNIRAQQSTHYVLSADYNFNIKKRPFKLTMEGYYKDYKDLIPYELDNVQLRYYARNNAEGYATGLDFRIFGEFVKGVDSWISMGIMKTEEDILDDSYWERYNAEGELIVPGVTFDQQAVDSVQQFPGYIPRLTDQRFRFGLFFQDYIPRIPAMKVNLNFIFATGLPFGPPTEERYKDTLRMPSYKRVDIGFSYEFLRYDRKKKSDGFFSHFDQAWVSLEVFNLFGINNTISYLWIRDISNRVYGIPNFLTNRRVNLKVAFNF